jgi:glycosyltransferase involved in cell wall biosynthesis
MRVAIEAASLALSSGGLARYTGELSLALARCFPEDCFFLVSDQPFRMPAGASVNLQRGGGPRNVAERRWWMWGLSRESARLQVDVFHGPDFAVPYVPKLPSVMTLHDVSPWLNPGWHHAAGRVRRRTPVLLELGIATMVITPSESVRKQVIDRFHVAANRVVAIPEAPAPWLHKSAHKSGTGYAIPNYFLFVGTLEPRKNLPALIEAFREVRAHHDVNLVLAGRPRADAPKIPEMPGLHVLGEVPDADLPALYSNALALVYPSLYEGFGLPVLEAMQCGACVIASSAVAEAGGQAAVYADTPEALADAMRQALSDPEWLAGKRALSLARAREFSWERTARLTYEVYREARNRFGQ